MTRSEYIDAAEQRRKRREDELLLLLMILLTRSIDEGILAFRHGLDYRVVLGNRILGNPDARMKGALPAILYWLVNTHEAGYLLAAKRIGTNTLPKTQISLGALEAIYVPSAREFAVAILAAITDAFQRGISADESLGNTVKRIRGEIESSGYSKGNPFSIERGVERQIVISFNNGIADAAISGKARGFQHISIIDADTTDICRSRNNLRLPIEHEYWRANWPPLHYGCRSVVDVLKNDQEWSISIPTIPPRIGFGKMPLEIAAMVNERNVFQV